MAILEQEKLSNFYLDKPEETRVFLLVLREVILDFDTQITEKWRYNTAYFYYRDKMFCYIGLSKKTEDVYLGIAKGGRIEHRALLSEGRTVVKILPLRKNEEVPVEILYEVFRAVAVLYT